jgi:hypothetical protein
MRRLGVTSTVRPSSAFCNAFAAIDALLAAVRTANSLWGTPKRKDAREPKRGWRGSPFEIASSQRRGSNHQTSCGGYLMIMGYTRMKASLRRSAGLDVDKSDMERLSELIGRKLNDLLVIGVRNAS